MPEHRLQPVAQTTVLPLITAESGLTRYLEEIRRFPMLQPQEEYMLAKRWREHGDRDAAHKLVTSHLRLVAKIAMGYRGYGLPISEVISEGNVGLMQAVKRFEPEKGFRLATYAMWWIKAAIQEYILRSWSLVKMGTTANQKKLFFNLRKAKSRISALEEGDMRPDQVKIIARRLGVTEQDVVDMNRRLSGDASLNAPIREEGDTGEWQDWLVDDHDNQEKVLAESEKFATRRKATRTTLSGPPLGISASISNVTLTVEPISPVRWETISSAMRPASRPTRVGSSVTLPWGRLGFRGGGFSSRGWVFCFVGSVCSFVGSVGGLVSDSNCCFAIPGWTSSPVGISASSGECGDSRFIQSKRSFTSGARARRRAARGAGSS